VGDAPRRLKGDSTACSRAGKDGKKCQRAYDHWQIDVAEATLRLGGLAATLAGRNNEPSEWSVKRDDVRELQWLANGTVKEVWAGWAHGRKVILKRLVRQHRDGRATSPRSDELHRGELLGELYFLEWLPAWKSTSASDALSHLPAMMWPS
jgi:hypothetical protein